jgi:hypothetical protein
VFWLILVALFIVVPLVAGTLIHAGSGGSVPQPAGVTGKSKRGAVRTVARTRAQTSIDLVQPAQPAERNP